jgi:hypothetical protein
MRRTLRYLVTALCFSFASAHAAVLQVTYTAGVPLLRGALGVDVGGTLYDVRFRGEACIDFWSFCTDFDFDTETEARVASQALLDQVLIDTPFVGPFDTFPFWTAGCGFSGAFCDVMTPFRRDSFDVVSVASARNYFIPEPFSGDAVYVFQDAARIEPFGKAWALWSLSSANPVPEPGTLALFGLGLFGLAWRLRKNA